MASRTSPTPRLSLTTSSDPGSPAAAAGRARIERGLYACGCGCKGRDPWHRRSYRRVVRSISKSPSGEPYTALGGGTFHNYQVAETGVAVFPWGESLVFKASSVDGGAGAVWYIERESALAAQAKAVSQ